MYIHVDQLAAKDLHNSLEDHQTESATQDVKQYCKYNERVCYYLTL